MTPVNVFLTGVRLVGAVLLLVPFVPAYMAGSAYQCVISAWRGGRSDTRKTIEGQ